MKKILMLCFVFCFLCSALGQYRPNSFDTNNQAGADLNMTNRPVFDVRVHQDIVSDLIASNYPTRANIASSNFPSPSNPGTFLTNNDTRGIRGQAGYVTNQNAVVAASGVVILQFGAQDHPSVQLTDSKGTVRYVGGPTFTAFEDDTGFPRIEVDDVASGGLTILWDTNFNQVVIVSNNSVYIKNTFVIGDFKINGAYPLTNPPSYLTNVTLRGTPSVTFNETTNKDGTLIKFLGSNAPNANAIPFAFNMQSSTEPSGGVDNVFSYGWNWGAGASRLVAGEPQLGYQFERQWNGTFEHYLSLIPTNNQTIRPWSWTFDRTNQLSYQHFLYSPYIDFVDGTTNGDPHWFIAQSHRLGFQQPVDLVSGTTTGNWTNSGNVVVFKLAGSSAEFNQNTGGNGARIIITNGEIHLSVLDDDAHTTFDRLLDTNQPSAGHMLLFTGIGMTASKFFPDYTSGNINANTFLSANTWQVKNSSGTFQTVNINGSRTLLGGSQTSLDPFPSITTDLGTSADLWKTLYTSNAVIVGLLTAPSNNAPFVVQTKTITLGTVFTNTTGQRAFLHYNGSHVDAATGTPILVVSNFTKGICWTNTIPGSLTATVPFSYDFPGWSTNDVGIAIDASTGSGASTAVTSAQFIGM